MGVIEGRAVPGDSTQRLALLQPCTQKKATGYGGIEGDPKQRTDVEVLVSNPLGQEGPSASSG